jgi:hypothetical protein
VLNLHLVQQHVPVLCDLDVPSPRNKPARSNDTRDKSEKQ